MTIDQARKQYPVGTWVRFYHSGRSVISPVIGHRYKIGGGADLQTEQAAVSTDAIIDARLPPS